MSKKVARPSAKDSTEFYLQKGVDIVRRRISLVEYIDQESTAIAMRGVQAMLDSDENKPIDIYINSFGGDPYSSFGLYDYLRSLKTTTIRTYNTGSAMSGASIIFLAGDQRFCYKNGVFMLHTVFGGAEGKPQDVRVEADELEQIHKQLCSIYGDITTKDAEYWNRHIKSLDRYIRADKALELGIITKIILTI